VRHALAALIASCLAICTTPAFAQKDFETIERGRVLATIGDCVACHTAPGGTPFAGGRGIPTPFGTVVTPNLTPDAATGIGAWTDDEFVRALQTGIGRDGEHLYPAFPYPYYTHVTREDLLAIRAFLNTLNPVRNAVERNKLDFPFDIRASMTGWNTLFFSAGRFEPNPDKSAEWNRGAYLVEGLGHCGACHTGKNLLGADLDTHRLQGYIVQDWFAPNLTGDLRGGLGNWSADEIVEYLRTGRNAKSAASGPMAEVITYSTSHLPEPELRAIATYLKDVPPVLNTQPEPLAADLPIMKAGAAIYADNCSACHTSGGGGIPKLFPSLKGSAVVQSAQPTTVLRVILEGALAASTDAAPTAPAMPPFAWKLSDDQVAAVATYIRNAWGNAAPEIGAGDARALRQRLATAAAD
jgi:mono/diheme cytochrome c family protein